MLSALKKLFRRRSIERIEVQPDCEASGERDHNKKQAKKLQKQQSKATKKQRRELVTRVDESDGIGRPLTNSTASTEESYGKVSGGAPGSSCGIGFGDCNKTGISNETGSSSSGSSSSNTSSSSSSGSDNCSSSSCSPNCNSGDSVNRTGPIEATQKLVTEAGDKLEEQQQPKQLECQTQIAEDYEEERDEDYYDGNSDDNFSEELEDGPVAYITEAPPKQQQHHQQQQAKKQPPANKQLLSKPITAGQLRKTTPQSCTSHQHHGSKTDVDQLLTGSVSQQHRKDTVRGNLEELRVAESINYRSVVYEYSFRVKNDPANMRAFSDPSDRRIEAIARSCGTQIQLEQPKSSSRYYETRTRRVTIQAPDLHSLEKCCRQFDERFPHFFVCGGLGQGSKSIKRVYVDDLDAQEQ
ncbi:hypothetical protein BOX15_Mlig033664g4 [Macrostomum lignano]|uniref:Uncharacterized protein n=1 Tax=Macrostomum lignano TaxID=282301 RepID=A0A267ESV3_9PLAT|nr:hypothetical protein BOX15_Mlig033664g2 [Macrostomum lignano]PAA76269.1 hypothetical protein BOX15_Mlig033664g4 [Macrostomum lignano]